MSQTADVVSAVRLLTHGNTEESFVTIPTDGEVCVCQCLVGTLITAARNFYWAQTVSAGRRAQGVASHTAGSSEARK